MANWTKKQVLQGKFGSAGDAKLGISCIAAKPSREIVSKVDTEFFKSPAGCIAVDAIRDRWLSLTFRRQRYI